MSEWHKDPEQLSYLLNLMNSEGYVLEDRIIAILSKKFGSENLKARQVFERPGPEGKERVEIDALLRRSISYNILEAKKCAYDWIFLRGPQTKQHLHLLRYTEKDLSTYAILQDATHPTDSFVAETAFEVLAIQNGNKLKTKDGKSLELKFPDRPTNREVVRPAVKQLLKNLETFANNEDLRQEIHSTLYNIWTRIEREANSSVRNFAGRGIFTPSEKFI